MKNSIKIFALPILLVLLLQIDSYSQNKNGKGFYVGFGTSLSSYIGGDFGRTFAIRVTNGREYYDNYDYYYNRDSRYYSDNNSSLNPLQIDLALGYNITKNFAVQLETSFLWHTKGKIDSKLEYTYDHDNTYIDRNDNSMLIAVPIFASLKIYPLSRKVSSFYISGGYGVQFMRERFDRIRQVYNYDYYGYSYYANSFEYPIAEYSGTRWLKGFKAAMGFSYNLAGSLRGDIELRITNFSAGEQISGSPLNMYKTPHITNIALGTKLYFNL